MGCENMCERTILLIKQPKSAWLYTQKYCTTLVLVWYEMECFYVFLGGRMLYAMAKKATKSVVRHSGRIFLHSAQLNLIEVLRSQCNSTTLALFYIIMETETE